MVHMDFQPSDALFLLLVALIAYAINNSGGGGRRARMPLGA
jgi:hypothetical protein